MPDVPDEVRKYFSRLGKTTAKRMTAEQRKARASEAGSKAAENLSEEERKARARRAAEARWAKKKAAPVKKGNKNL